jgi:hypothetical protein
MKAKRNPRSKKFIYHVEFNYSAWECIEKATERLKDVFQDSFRYWDYMDELLKDRKLITEFDKELDAHSKRERKKDRKNIQNFIDSIKYVSHSETENPLVNKFVFEISVRDIPYIKKNTKFLFGVDYFNSDYGIDIIAREKLWDSAIHPASNYNCISAVKCHVIHKGDEENINKCVSICEEKQDFCEKLFISLKLIKIV